MVRMRLARLIVPLVLCGAASFAQGQAVYKCQSQGKTTYSQEPCLGAQIIETAPAQGLDGSSGKSRNGNDGLRREKRDKKDKDQALADALKPFDETPSQREKRQRRAKLSASELSECSALDAQETEQASVIHNSRNIDAVNAAAGAFIANRKRYRELGC